MSRAAQRIRDIRDTQVGATEKRVLVVEGEGDVAAYSQFLKKQFSDWERTWSVAPAGSKKIAIAIAQRAPDWLVLVDRDEWSEEQIARYQRETPNLLVLPRFCLESYLVDPEELWQAFPPKQREKVPGGLEQLRVALLADLASWQRHAALWKAINPLWTGLRALGFKDTLLKTQTIPDDVVVKATLQQWSDYIDAPRIFDEFQLAMVEIDSLSVPDFLRHRLYAKDFYPRVVHPLLDRLLGQRSEPERRQALYQTLPVPEDLKFVWARMRLDR